MTKHNTVAAGSAKKTSGKWGTWALLALVLMLAVVEPAFAQGGLDKVNTFAQNIQAILTGVSITVVTVAIMWAGYKFLFKHADIMEVGKIVLAGLLIGGAGQLASYLLG